MRSPALPFAPRYKLLDAYGMLPLLCDPNIR